MRSDGTLEVLGRPPLATSAAKLSVPSERLVFSLATVAIGLHVIVDAFVTPEPGASRTDHLLSAAVPIAVVVGAVSLYPHLRSGARASAAVLFGLLALVGAGIAVVHAVHEGPSGDDWTGFMLVPAGIVLCGLGAGLLWRSRKQSGRGYLRRALLAVVVVVVGYEIVLPLAFALVATHKPRSSVASADLGRPYEEITLRTSDGLDLAAWYVPSLNRAAVIAFPGRSGPIEHARMLVRHGYGVLLLDMRGQGVSEGDPNGFGWGSTKDLDAAVAFLQARPDVDDAAIGGLGLSVGGEQLLESAADNSGLRAIVSDGAGERSVRETLLRGPAGALAIPQQAVLTAAVAVLSGDAPPPALDNVVARISPRSLFFIYAGRGGGGEELSRDYYEAAGEPKALWYIPEAGHTDGLRVRPREYERWVLGFFDRALLGQP
jgi:hypothetical protein